MSKINESYKIRIPHLNNYYWTKKYKPHVHNYLVGVNSLRKLTEVNLSRDLYKHPYCKWLVFGLLVCWYLLN